MQESLLSILRCPVTRTALTVRVIKKATKVLNGQPVNIIEEAVLYAGADWLYPVIHGIPRLNVEAFLDYEPFLRSTENDYDKRKENLIEKYGALVKYAVKKNKRTKESFTKEWALYDHNIDKTWDADDAAMVERFFKETGETPGTLKDKIIFDAGCGNGKLDLLIASHCTTVVGMDFANCIEAAYSGNQFANVHFIEGDIQYPPLVFDHFDIVHCSGVLIHTHNAELSFSCIEPTVKVNGKLSVWLYHPRKDLVHNLFNATRKVTSKLPLSFQYWLYRFTIFPISFFIKRIKGNRQNSREMMVNILDWFTPEFRWEIEHAEVESWFLKKGYKNTRITTVDTFGFNTVGEKK